VNKEQTDIEIVYRLICRHPGYPVAWLSWVMAGGQIRDGQPVGKTTGHNFQVHHKLHGVQKRVNELVDQGKIVMGQPSVKTHTRGQGCFPINENDIIRHQAPNMPPDVICQRQKEHSSAWIADLKKRTGG